MLNMSKLRIIPSILGRLVKPGTFSSNAKVLTHLDETACMLKIPVIKTFEHPNSDWKSNPVFTLFSAGLVSLASVVGQEQDGENDCFGDNDNELHEVEPENDSELQEVEPENNSHEDDLGNDVSQGLSQNEDNEADSMDQSYLASEEELKKINVEFIEGDKPDSKWLVVDEVYICHRYQGTELETFWECGGRRKYGCPFKLGTVIDDDGNLEVSFMYKFDCHHCGQTKLGPIMQTFRSTLKNRMKSNYKAKFHKVFNEEKKSLITKYSDSPGLLELIVYELKDKRSYRVAAQRAKQKCFPKNPVCHEDIDLKKIGLEKYELGRCSHFDPEVKNKDVILLGTPLSAQAWAKSEFKSGDGTFKICPKQFYQVKSEIS